ncbi:AraC family transcriptional regulator [Aquimarina sp. 2201CG5-10]|uniref:helix-turn-helix domain-containing protein n=1 Tax=Aquimarina callyspongiae TaxID=3098150 RepID=UPI002AB5D456|nr:AraC family transcriptional regulator [Aquimarina sp. 2201CG5-10]MDY8134767.1 AraC family transcriptional regulator [Aquimarina sp. 2201CG5-10]
MKVVPQAFYKHPNIEKIFVDGLSCVILKRTQSADLQNERYLGAHALTLVLNGALRVESSEGSLTTAQKNQMLFLPKGLYMISDVIPKNESFDAVVFFFDQEIIDEFLINFEDTSLQEIKGVLTILYNQNLRLFVDSLLTLYKGKHQNQFTKPKLLELLHLISISEEGQTFIHHLKALKSRERKNIKRFMSDNYHKPLDIEDYAYLTGRSISTFRRDFKSKFGISPKKWLIQKRLEKAAHLLIKKNDSVTDISTQVGYENTSHFIKAFHKKFNTSPKQYQIKYRKKTLI